MILKIELKIWKDLLLSLLEVNTESLRVEDSEGNNRFKSGIFVDDFTDKFSSDESLTTADIVNGELRLLQ